MLIDYLPRADTYDYRTLRAKGWTAKEAFKASRDYARFLELEGLGPVEFRVVRDDDTPLEDLVCLNDIKDKFIFAIQRRVDGEGVCGIVSAARATALDPWTVADSCFGFIGFDWLWSGHDLDVLSSAVDLHKELVKSQSTLGCGNT